MYLQTERLILRPWRDSDAESLYKYASSPLVGPNAGWPPHTSVENSREIIANVLSSQHNCAIVVKATGEAVGAIGIMIGEKSNIGIPDTEFEIGYWIGVPYWGQGLVPEAVKEVLRYGFEELHMQKAWCGYFDGNEKSRRVQEKCGFIYQFTKYDTPCSMLDELKTEHITCLTCKQWSETQK